jgi:phosphoribosylformylglycinamidine (FGAM) synthase-like enzyme
VPAPDHDAPARYRRVHQLILDGFISAAHDVSEGGVAVALAEMALAADASLAVTLTAPDLTLALFGEGPGRMVLAVAASRVDEALVRLGADAVVVGAVGLRSRPEHPARLVVHGHTNADLAGAAIDASPDGVASVLIDVALGDARAAFQGGPW